VNAKMKLNYKVSYTEFDTQNLRCEKFFEFSTDVNINSMSLRTGRKRAIAEANKRGIGLYRIFDIELIGHD